jgi:hypothetical protein
MFEADRILRDRECPFGVLEIAGRKFDIRCFQWNKIQGSIQALDEELREVTKLEELIALEEEFALNGKRLLRR